MAGAPGGRGEFSVDECAKDALVFRVGLLVPVMGPDLLGKRELGGGEFADGGGCHGCTLHKKRYRGQSLIINLFNKLL